MNRLLLNIINKKNVETSKLLTNIFIRNKLQLTSASSIKFPNQIRLSSSVANEKSAAKPAPAVNQTSELDKQQWERDDRFVNFYKVLLLAFVSFGCYKFFVFKK